MDSQTGKMLTDFVMMVGLLRRDMKHPSVITEFGRYEGRFARIDKKLSDLAEFISAEDPELAKALHTAFQQPSRALAFKNAEHQKEIKRKKENESDPDADS